VEKDITEIEIDAPPSRVWEIVTDFEKYASWNPFIKKISGIPTRNEKLEVYMPDPRWDNDLHSHGISGRKGQRAKVDWQVRGDVFNGEHHFLIEPTETITKCALSKVKNLQVHCPSRISFARIGN
jgi:Polyketide cyclase / dehydrase and lipid transport